MVGSGTNEAVLRLFETARETWPDLACTPSRFAAYVAERAPAGASDANLAAMQGADLLLACACADGDPDAIRAFEEKCIPPLTKHVRRIDPSPSFLEEVAQRLRVRLFVGSVDATPRIVEYRGRGPIDAWLRVVAVRIALNLCRERQGTSTAETPEPGRVPTGGPDPELDYLRARYAEDLRQALESTLRGLSRDERTVLRLHFLDGLNAAQISGVFGVHRATVGRWIEQAREKILGDVRARLVERLQVSPLELESLLKLLHSQLELDIAQLLAESGPASTVDV